MPLSANTRRFAGSKAMKLPRYLLSSPILLYRKLLSPLLGNRCRYYPSCSAYALEALGSFGIARGSVLAVWRIVRCNPFSNGGIDYVCEQRIFRSRAVGLKKATGA